MLSVVRAGGRRARKFDSPTYQSGCARERTVVCLFGRAGPCSGWLARPAALPWVCRFFAQLVTRLCMFPRVLASPLYALRPPAAARARTRERSRQRSPRLIGISGLVSLPVDSNRALCTSIRPARERQSERALHLLFLASTSSPSSRLNSCSRSLPACVCQPLDARYLPHKDRTPRITRTTRSLTHTSALALSPRFINPHDHDDGQRFAQYSRQGHPAPPLALQLDRVEQGD